MANDTDNPSPQTAVRPPRQKPLPLWLVNLCSSFSHSCVERHLKKPQVGSGEIVLERLHLFIKKYSVPPEFCGLVLRLLWPKMPDFAGVFVKNFDKSCNVFFTVCLLQ